MDSRVTAVQVSGVEFMQCERASRCDELILSQAHDGRQPLATWK